MHSFSVKVCKESRLNSIFKADSLDFVDFAAMANYWLQENCVPCSGANLTGDSNVTFEDLEILAQNWLSGK